MADKRYFKILIKGFESFEGNWEFVLEDEDEMYLLYHPDFTGHSGGDRNIIETHQQGHCWWFDKNECEEVCRKTNFEECCEETHTVSSSLLNKKVVDIHNNYTGIVTAYAVYNTGLEIVLVVSIDDNGRPIAEWIDIKRIEEE